MTDYNSTIKHVTARETKLMQTRSNEVFFPQGQEYGNWKDDVNQYIN